MTFLKYPNFKQKKTVLCVFRQAPIFQLQCPDGYMSFEISSAFSEFFFHFLDDRIKNVNCFFLIIQEGTGEALNMTDSAKAHQNLSVKMKAYDFFGRT